jgi:hypothetical protein
MPINLFVYLVIFLHLFNNHPRDAGMSLSEKMEKKVNKSHYQINKIFKIIEKD